ncbi:MAG: DUF4003 family protein [Deltaproteobacteria bacterium]|nr:DUF4003 family protein [Nannocystaceae bacterium]
MPFRDDAPSRPAVIEPLVRFGQLYAALDAGRGTLGDRAPLRLAAVTLIGVPGETDELVARVRAADAELAPSFGWTSSVDSSVRMVLAAALVRTGESVASFVAGSQRVSALIKAAGIRWAGVHGVLAGMVLRRVVGGEPSEGDVDRMRAIHAVMKKHHWFLTGPEDLTTCAMLIGKPGSPQEIGDHVEAIYRRLANAPKTWGGDQLQSAAGVLALVGLGPDEAADRFLAVATALRAGGVKIGQAEYDEVAVLSFVPRGAEVIATEVAELRMRIDAELSWAEDAMATSLAVNLSFVRLVADEADTRVAALADAKLLLDMQSIVAMRQAASVAVMAAT